MSDPRSAHSVNPADRLKVGHLVTGLVFLAVAVLWALRTSGIVGSFDLGVVAPVVLVAAGLIGLLAMTVPGARRRRQTDDSSTDINTTKEIEG